MPGGTERTGAPRGLAEGQVTGRGESRAWPKVRVSGGGQSATVWGPEVAGVAEPCPEQQAEDVVWGANICLE